MSKIIKQTRKKYSNKVKFQIITELLRERKSQAEIARSYDIHSNLITRWKDQFFENGYKVFESKSSVDEKGQIIWIGRQILPCPASYRDNPGSLRSYRVSLSHWLSANCP